MISKMSSSTSFARMIEKGEDELRAERAKLLKTNYIDSTIETKMRDFDLTSLYYYFLIKTLLRNIFNLLLDEIGVEWIRSSDLIIID